MEWISVANGYFSTIATIVAIVVAGVSVVIVVFVDVTVIVLRPYRYQRVCYGGQERDLYSAVAIPTSPAFAFAINSEKVKSYVLPG